MHDFEAVSDPIDAAKQFVFTHVWMGGAREMERDFRLDARFRKAR
jgi:hypothetical protein